MGSTESKVESKTIYKSESLFWSAWYNKTRDYSVGPATTIFNDRSLNEFNHKRTLSVLITHRYKEGQYFLIN